MVENRTGAGGTIGAGVVARSAPDGYTILAYGALATAHALYTKLPYDTFDDFIPVIPFGEQRQLVTVSPPSPYKTLGDLIAAGKAKPGALNYSTVGLRLGLAFCGAALPGRRRRRGAGTSRSRAPAKRPTEIIAGRVDFSVQTSTSTLALIRERQAAALAVSAHKRLDALPDVPTVIEAGLAARAVYRSSTAGCSCPRRRRANRREAARETAQALQAPAVRPGSKRWASIPCR